MRPFAILLSAALAYAGSVGPQASPSPLKTIVTIKTSPICTALHESVAPAVVKIRTNDLHFEESASVFMDMAHAANNQAFGEIELDKVRLMTQERAIEENIRQSENLLADPRIAKATSSQPQLLHLKESLERVLYLQNAALNVISGTVESSGAPIGWMINPSTKSFRQASLLPSPLPSTMPTDPPPPISGNAPTPVASGPAIGRSMKRLTGIDLNSAYYQLARALAGGQIREQPLEGAAAASIVLLAKDCR